MLASFNAVYKTWGLGPLHLVTKTASTSCLRSLHTHYSVPRGRTELIEVRAIWHMLLWIRKCLSLLQSPSLGLMLWSPCCIITPNYLTVIAHLGVVSQEWESRGGRAAFYEWSRMLVCCVVRANADILSVQSPPLSLSPKMLTMVRKSVSSLTWTPHIKSTIFEIWRWNISSKGKASWSWKPVVLPLQLEATWQVAVERTEHGSK